MKILRKAMNKEANQSDIETIFVDNEKVNEKQEISEWFNDHFATVGEKLAKDIPQSSKSSLEYLSKLNKNDNKFKIKMLKPTEIYTILGRLKNGKATGMHLILNRALKDVKDIIPSYTKVFGTHTFFCLVSLTIVKNISFRITHGAPKLTKDLYVITIKYQRISFIAYLMKNFPRFSFPAGGN